jgi:Ca2+-binding RTX toxin-like protein
MGKDAAMQTKLGLACWIGCLMITSSAVVAGCGDDAKQPTSGGAAGAAAGGADPSGLGGSGSGEDGGAGTSRGGSSGAGARPNVDPGGPDDPSRPPEPSQPGAGGAEDGGADAPDFDGVDLEDVSESAPSGCVGGFDPELGTLELEVGGDAPVVHVAVHAGVVQANGVDCESASGEPARADAVSNLRIVGSEGDDAVYLDLSDEAFSGCFSGEGAIEVSLGAGTDRVAVLGTLDKDSFQLGSDGDALLLDVTGDDRADVSVLGAPAVVLSTGGEQDLVRADGVALGVEAASLPLRVYGGGNRDSLSGGAANDELFGGIGNDWFDAGAEPAGGDTFDGGEGVDTIDFSARVEPLTVTLGAGKDDGQAGEGADVQDSVENLYGGQARNEITGGDNDNHVWGGPEDDVLAGGAGDDTLSGSSGDDRISGGPGYDYLYGEEGDDDLQGGTEDDLLDGFEGADTLNGGPGDGDICVVIDKTDKATACEL